MFLAWLSQYSKYKQGELSEDDYDNWRYDALIPFSSGNRPYK